MASKPYRRRKCPCCREWFMPQAHNAYHQRYCTAPHCRRVSKYASHRKWLRKQKRAQWSKLDVIRVQNWRAEHPGYWRRSRPRQKVDIRISLTRRSAGTQRLTLVAAERQGRALRDLYVVQATRPHAITAHLERALHNLIGLRCAGWYERSRFTGRGSRAGPGPPRPRGRHRRPTAAGVMRGRRK